MRVCVMLQASERLYYVYQTLLDTTSALEASPEGQQAVAAAEQQLQDKPGHVDEVMQHVHEGMCDDLNTPQALAALSAPLKAMNDLLSTKKVSHCITLWHSSSAMNGLLQLD